MKAALFYEARSIQIEDIVLSDPKENEVLIRIKMAGLCGSDLHRYLGERNVKYKPIVLGHEFVGVVDKVGNNVKNFKPGDKVVGNPFFSCGHCKFCLEGHRNLCQSRSNIGIDSQGCFSEFIIMPETSLWKIEESVNDIDAVMTEPIAIALRAIKMAGSLLGKNVAVIGAGTMGQIIAYLAVKAGATVTTIDVVDKKLDISKQLCVSHTINSMSEDPIEGIKKYTNGLGPDVVIETAGIPITVEQAVKMVRFGGLVIVIGLSTQTARIAPIDIARREITIVGSVMYVEEFEEAVKLINKRILNFDKIISHVLPLEECRNGFELMISGKDAMKVLLNISK